MKVIPISAFSFASRHVPQSDKRVAIKIALKALQAGASEANAYMAGKRYISHQNPTQGGAA